MGPSRICMLCPGFLAYPWPQDPEYGNGLLLFTQIFLLRKYRKEHICVIVILQKDRFKTGIHIKQPKAKENAPGEFIKITNFATPNSNSPYILFTKNKILSQTSFVFSVQSGNSLHCSKSNTLILFQYI